MTKRNNRFNFSNFLQISFLQSALVILKSFVLRFAIQSIYFVILARTFGPEKYGSYLGIVALISIFIPFASWGSGEILIQNVSRKKELFREYFGTAILKSIFFGTILTLFVLILYTIIPIPHISIYSVLFLALANLIFLKLNDLAKDSFLSMGLMNQTGTTIIILSLNRLLAILCLITFFATPSLFIWCTLYCLATLIAAAIGLFLVIKTLGYPKFNVWEIKNDLKTGFYFSIGTSASNIYNDLDKSMLAKLSTTEAAGIYGAAYHIVSVSLLPILSLLYASIRNFFQQGASGIKSSFELCKKLLPLSLFYSLIAIAGLFIFSPLLPNIIGEQYLDSVTALRLLSPVIFLRTMHVFAADTLTGADFQSTRSIMQILVAVLNGLLNFWLIPIYHWHGAIWATIISEFLLMVFLWSSVYFYSKRSLSV